MVRERRDRPVARRLQIRGVMKTIDHIARGCLTCAEILAPAASRFGRSLLDMSRWIEDRRTRLAILATIAD
jgi:hypothetical protein